VLNFGGIKMPTSKAFGFRFKGCGDAEIGGVSHVEKMHEQGLSITEIAKKTGYNRRTVRKYLRSDVPPIAERRSPKASKLDDYKDYIIQRLNSYPLTASRIYHEIQEKGFTGKYTIVKDSFERYALNWEFPPSIVMRPNHVSRLKWIGKNVVISRLMERHGSSTVSRWFSGTLA
jgi:transposase